jgi:hypothetical protein
MQFVHPDMPLTGPHIKVKGLQRRCGACTMCCTHVPVTLPPPAGQKAAGVPCPYLSGHRGCGIYAKRPRVCVAWSCRWLFDRDTAELQRPDQSGYIISPDLQTLLIDDDPLLAVQVWVDPARPDAHRDPALRAYLLKLFQRHRLLAAVRTHNQEGEKAMLLIPPIEPNGEWVERYSDMISEETMQAKVRAVVDQLQRK